MEDNAYLSPGAKINTLEYYKSPESSLKVTIYSDRPGPYQCSDFRSWYQNHNEDVAVVCYQDKTFQEMVEQLKILSFLYDECPNVSGKWRLYKINKTTTIDTCVAILRGHRSILILADHPDRLSCDTVFLQEALRLKFPEKKVYISDLELSTIEFYFNECLMRTVNPSDILPQISDSEVLRRHLLNME